MAHNFDSIGPFEFTMLQQRQISILQRIELFFTQRMIIDTLVPLVEQQSGISLRALDWLVTNYSKKHNIVCRNKAGGIFNIYHGYKVALGHFRRRNFDPFRRRNRIRVMVDNEVVSESTVGQCNFLYWAINNGVLAYAIEHAKQIEADMNSASAYHKAERKMQRAQGMPHRRKELSRAPQTKCSVYQINSSVTFGCVGGSDSEDEPPNDDSSNGAQPIC